MCIMRNSLLLHPENPAFQHEWAIENITTTFFKCTRWQVEETTDPVHCPYHYYCDSIYLGNYPQFMDYAVLLLTAASYLVTLAFMVLEINANVAICFSQARRRYWLPSGSIALPFILLALANGHRVNTIFPVSCIGPALLQLLYVSALAFQNSEDKNINYMLLEVSKISGILHASLYLDSIILPHYTGLDALLSSTFSGECASCICRREVLEVGGKLITYRGWSKTTFLVVGALCLKIISRHFGEDKRWVMIMFMMEVLGWVSVAADSVYLLMNTPCAKFMESAAFGGVIFLISLRIVKVVCGLFPCPTAFRAIRNATDLRITIWE